MEVFFSMVNVSYMVNMVYVLELRCMSNRYLELEDAQRAKSQCTPKVEEHIICHLSLVDRGHPAYTQTKRERKKGKGVFELFSSSDNLPEPHQLREKKKKKPSSGKGDGKTTRVEKANC
jgi:hypothetical protein